MIRTPHASAGNGPTTGVVGSDRRAAETVWASLAFDTNSPYLDPGAPGLVAGQPDQRRYRARYVHNDGPVGDWSDTVEVTAHP